MNAKRSIEMLCLWLGGNQAITAHVIRLLEEHGGTITIGQLHQQLGVRFGPIFPFCLLEDPNSIICLPKGDTYFLVKRGGLVFGHEVVTGD